MRNERADQAALRARWMAELAAAIESAQRVAWQLGTATNGSSEARELYAQLEAARVELESLRLGTRRLLGDVDPWLVERIGLPKAPDELPED